LAQALVNRPEVLFLDEPVSALDPAGRKEVLELIDSLRGQSTVFMSSHILEDVDRVCDSIGIINHGRLITKASRESLLAGYAQPIFDVEVETGMKARLEEWAVKLRGAPWVTTVTVDLLSARINVRNVETAKRELLPSALQAGLVLTRYEMMRPSLEDVFLRLVAEGGQTL
jgi:ABC-2 type transport system ATP-binding protein